VNASSSARLHENLAAVRGRIVDACRRASRPPGDVRLVGVTKYVSPELTAALVAAGCPDLAESRPQALWAKAEALAGVEPPPRWHLVGHLQSNKVRRTIGLVSLLHSLDSRRLLDVLEAEARHLGRPCDVLVEVNIAADPGRTGLPAEEVGPLLAAAAACEHVRVRGLMGMASVPEGSLAGGQARHQFAVLRELRDRLRADTPATMTLDELSMGMSGDFEEAILEGATLVRVGSALWEGVT
jgi:hypothetical protein